MSNEKIKLSNRQYFWERFLPENDPETIHYLTPLALAVFKHRLQKFTYPFNDMELVIEPDVANAIYQSIRDHIKRMKNVMQLAKLKHLKRDPSIRLFLRTPIKKLNLTTRIFNLLETHQCATMEDVAKKWNNELVSGYGLGNSSKQVLINLFDKHGCLILCL